MRGICLSYVVSDWPCSSWQFDMVKPLRAASINGRTECVKLLVARCLFHI